MNATEHHCGSGLIMEGLGFTAFVLQSKGIDDALHALAGAALICSPCLRGRTLEKVAGTTILELATDVTVSDSQTFARTDRSTDAYYNKPLQDSLS